MLIGYFTNRDNFLNKLITLLSVYLDSCKQCINLLESHSPASAEWTQEEIKAVQESSENAFKMAHMILNELKEIHTRYLFDDDDNIDKPIAKPKLSLNQYRYLDNKGRAQLLIDYEG